VISINMFTCFILLLKVIEILIVYTFNFGIKLCPKLPKFLTANAAPAGDECIWSCGMCSFAVVHAGGAQYDKDDSTSASVLEQVWGKFMCS